jgi:uncharacterized OB-fold protein
VPLELSIFTRGDELKMAESRPFTVESFYKLVDEGKVMAAKCNNCGNMLLPPRPACTKCFSKDLQWTQLNNSGKLLAYTVIHVAPKQFEAEAPYPVGIVKLDKGLQLLGRIRGIESSQLKIGMELSIDFEKTSNQPNTLITWPPWPRYYFRPKT